jgi:signal transduction histidine kinase
MKSWIPKPSKMLLVAILTIGLMGLLATLQYRWLGQISRGERERMQSSLRAGTARFSQDFNREITRVFLSFQMDSDGLRDKDSGEYAARYEQWHAQASFPKLVDEVYVLERGEEDQPRLLRFNPTAKKFDTVAWPAKFATIRQKLEQSFLGNNQDSTSGKEVTVDAIAADIPAIISPIITAPRMMMHERSAAAIAEQIKKQPVGVAFTDLTPLAGYVLTTLNLDVIRNELIPALAQRHFAMGDGIDYQLTILNPSARDHLVYQSSHSQAQRGEAQGDATARLMVIQPDQLDALIMGLPRKIVETHQRGDVFSKRLPPGQMMMRTEEQSQSGDSTSRSVTVRVFNGEIDLRGATEASMAAAAGPWQLIVRHPAGSLEAAVTSTRRRSLAISFGILLLLAGSVAIIVISTRRAERLAHRQMEFVSAVSHEFRTPLAVICSAGENLADGIVDTPQQIERYGELVRDEGRRLTEMIEQVLAFAGARSGRTPLQMRPLQIGPLIDDATTSYQPLNGEKDFVIEKDIQSGLPLVEGDAAALRRTLQNLLNNAMKYGNGARKIGIRARSVTNERGDEVQVTVEDQGIGIDPKDLPHIFEPFYRGSEVVAAQIHGNGLGLSLVKQVIDAHRGTITVASVPGQGSAFTLHLPVFSSSVGFHGNDSGGGEKT